MDIQRAKLLEKVTVRTQKIKIDPAQGTLLHIQSKTRHIGFGFSDKNIYK